jgi:hypothetical protein
MSLVLAEAGKNTKNAAVQLNILEADSIRSRLFFIGKVRAWEKNEKKV